MNTIKSLGFAGVAVTALFATQAFATITCPAGQKGSHVCVAEHGGGNEQSLQQLVDSITTSGPSIDVYNDQASPSSYWQIGVSGTSVNGIVFEIAGNANINAFGIFDPNSGKTLQLFSGPDGVGKKAILDSSGDLFCNGFCGDPSSTKVTFSGDTFGYYLQSGNNIFYSDMGKNADEMAHMVAYQGNDQTVLNVNGHTGKFLSNEWLLAWEDLPLGQSDWDYNDFVVTVESVYPVPEPAALGMFGLGVLLIGGFVALRRRSALDA